jgi:hypothetical protein
MAIAKPGHIAWVMRLPQKLWSPEISAGDSPAGYRKRQLALAFVLTIGQNSSPKGWPRAQLM